MKWRLIGPFVGRVLTVAGVPSQPNTYYFGAVAGGVWKTTDGGVSWDRSRQAKHFFDRQRGCRGFRSQRPLCWIRRGCNPWKISFGDGVYRRMTPGRLGQHRFEGHPAHRQSHHSSHNSDIAFVAALGHAYGANTERGIFRTRDGGKNWEKFSISTTTPRH